MEFMILIYGDESSPRLAPGDPGFDEYMGSWMAYNQSLIERGHWVGGANLAPTTSATTLRLTPGQATEIVDGPFAETKEQFGGFYIVEADTWEEAAEWAKKMPIREGGSVEVRPVMEFDRG